MYMYIMYTDTVYAHVLHRKALARCLPHDAEPARRAQPDWRCSRCP